MTSLPLRHLVPFCMLLGVTHSAFAQKPKPSPTPVPPPAQKPSLTQAPTPATPVIETPDYVGATWAAAAPGNFQPASRPTSSSIDYIVIHDIEGLADWCVSWFQNPKAGVSSHYVVDSATGKVWQMVKERDVAWHAGNKDINTRSVGIEHGGYAYRPGYYTITEYEASARLVRDISIRNNVARDRTHIIGHFEVPNPKTPGKFGGASGHTDPGPYWDWDYFMTLVRNDATVGTNIFPTVLHPGEKLNATVEFTNTGDDLWPTVPGQHDPDREQQGPVYLGAWTNAVPTGGAMNTSPLFATGAGGWISPSIAASAAVLPGQPVTDTAPGQVARFVFPIQAPLSVPTTPITEQFRLIKMPPAPRLPVGFGPTIPISVRVEPWEVTADATNPDTFIAGTGWTKKTVGKNTIWVKPATNNKDGVSTAHWSVKLPVSGEWDIYVRYPSGSGHSKRAVYLIETAAGRKTVILDQTKGGNTWQKLGRFPLNSSAPAVVLLAGARDGAVDAESLRFTGPFAPLPPDLPKPPATP